uniref:Uncharacterized protein n=1 Tax=Siphoviridae sp. ct0Wl9 TaxID=2827763 RepID=A0A8S5TAF2_9CAUD|nr:MAG TPA: hypothetical protein [Siphoviridae sp. ct0Wl9]
MGFLRICLAIYPSTHKKPNQYALLGLSIVSK